MEDISDRSSQLIKIEDLFETWLLSPKQERILLVANKIQELLHINECPDNIRQKILKLSEFYSLRIDSKWKASYRKREVFQKKNDTWLKRSLSLPEEVTSYLSSIAIPCAPSTSRGRPRKRFEECSIKTKKLRVEELVQRKSTEELRFASDLSMRLSGSPSKQDKSLTIQQTLALYLDLDLSKRKYGILRSVVNSLHSDCFPSYYKLKQYKDGLVPENIVITETTMEVNLQSLLNKTAQSIINILQSKSVTFNENEAFTLICKWGFDGSSGHSTYKHIFEDASNTDSFLFATALVPLKLINKVTKNDVWTNPKPGSTLFCRPVKLDFLKENKDVIIAEETRMNAIIDELEDFTAIILNGKNIKIGFEMLFTMLDGSAINVLSRTNVAQNCYLCGAKPTEMNLPSVSQRPSNTDNYKFGLSSLHLWIRCFQCMLNISYRLPFKTWQIKSEKKPEFLDRKKAIQAAFKSQMGLNVDIPKPGYGTTNDGDTARTFFSNAKLSSEITGVNEDLIKNLNIILRVIASGQNIVMEKFKILIENTKQLYLENYEWYYMPSSMHKLLIHGSDIISSFDLPIGILSEEALEARHKEFRRNRLYHTRKSSRLNSNKDLINIMLITSDPFISTLRKINRNKCTHQDTDISEYLLLPETEEHSYSFNLPAQLNLSDTESEDSQEE